ncbi:hypothetical protein HPG69_003937, partial [Diceros bicornis minor]
RTRGRREEEGERKAEALAPVWLEGLGGSDSCAGAVQKPPSPVGGPRLGDRGRKWANGTCSSRVTLFLCLTVQLNLQAWPNPMCEGYVLTLRCQGMRNAALTQVEFYKDRKFLHFSTDNQPLSVGTATVKNSGQNTCTGQVTCGPYMSKQTSGTTLVQVQELFPHPVLSAIPSPEPHEGSPVTLRCQTKLHPQRRAMSCRTGASTQNSASQEPRRETLGFTGARWPLREAGSRNRAPSWRSGCGVSGGGRGDPPQRSGHQAVGPWECGEGSLGEQEPGAWVVQLTLPSRVLPQLLPGPTSFTVGDVVELLCEAQRGSSLIPYSFYLDGEILGNHLAPYGGATSLLFLVTSEQGAGNYPREAENSVSKESSGPETLSLDGTFSSQLAAFPFPLVAEVGPSAEGTLRPHRQEVFLEHRLPLAQDSLECQGRNNSCFARVLPEEM